MLKIVLATKVTVRALGMLDAPFAILYKNGTR